MKDSDLLRDVLQTLPGDMAADIPLRIRMLENPSSPIAFPGAIDLFGHDCVHVLLGRGLTQRAEAFVVGFTMGSATEKASLRLRLFPWLASCLYRGIYRFSGLDRKIFTLGAECARSMKCVDLSNVMFEDLLATDIASAQVACRIDRTILHSFIKPEMRLALQAGQEQGTSVCD